MKKLWRITIEGKMKYNIIYADPPWTFNTYSEKGKERKSAELHYKCMDINDIYNLPISNIAKKDSVLFLWVTNPMLQEGLETMKKWGFLYKTVAFSWYKRNKISDSFFMGLGYWTRQNTEMCLLGIKGKPSRISKGVHQIIDNDFFIDTEQIDDRIMKHSRKPIDVRNKIVNLMGDLPRCELFAREKADGWDSYGFEIDGMDIYESITNTP